MDHCRRGKGVIDTYSECMFVALVIQHAVRVRHIVTCICLALPYFSVWSHKRHYFRGGGGVIGRKNLCSVFLCNFGMIHLSF
jgi:hypothetical protein